MPDKYTLPLDRLIFYLQCIYRSYVKVHASQILFCHDSIDSRRRKYFRSVGLSDTDRRVWLQSDIALGTLRSWKIYLVLTMRYVGTFVRHFIPFCPTRALFCWVCRTRFTYRNRLSWSSSFPEAPRASRVGGKKSNSTAPRHFRFNGPVEGRNVCECDTHGRCDRRRSVGPVCI